MLEKADILVVDDEPLNVELLKAILEPKNYGVLTAANGTQALEILAREKVDLVLLDVVMPGIDGYEVTRRIRASERTKAIPVILITALHETSERIVGIDAGCDEFLTKPFDKNEVLARLRTLLRLSFYRAQVDEKGRLEQAAQHSNDGLIVCDAAMRVLRADQRAKGLLGIAELAPDWIEQLGRDFKVGYAGDLKRDLGLKALDLVLERHASPAVKPQTLSFSSSLIKDSAGKTVSTVIVLNDITHPLSIR
jgi:DNA-binding response OmpR family regulator